MNEYTAILATIVFGALIAMSVVGGEVEAMARNMFALPHADFSAKFVKP